MKKLKALLFSAFILVAGSTFAQTTQPATQTKPATTATKKVEKDKATAKTEGVKLKKDGTPDKRYNENKHLKKDGTPDKRFKANADSTKKAKTKVQK